VFYWLENLCEQKDFNQLANDIVINGVKHLIKIDKKRTYEVPFDLNLVCGEPSAIQAVYDY
jgi:hypothetical protein